MKLSMQTDLSSRKVLFGIAWISILSNTDEFEHSTNMGIVVTS
jgi:hypothetical protein